jgi:hypothetical protein
MKTVLTKLNIPDTAEIKGTFLATDAKLIIDKEPYGKITGGVIKITMDNKINVNGVDISFTNSYSHTLTTNEMDELMLKFSK